MKVAQMARLLDSLFHGLDGVVTGPVSHDFKSFRDAMQPFENATVAEFTHFLAQFGAEFQQTGKITPQGKVALNKPVKPPKEPKPPKLDAQQRVAASVTAIQELLAEINRGSVDDARVEQILKPVGKLTIPLLHEVLDQLKIAEKPKQKPKIFDKIRQVIHHQMESHMRHLAVGSSPVHPEPVGNVSPSASNADGQSVAET